MRSRLNPLRVVPRLFEAMLGRGINPTLVAGLVLMPAVVAVGYLADGHQRGVVTATLRGSLDGLPDVSGAASPPPF